MSQPNNQCNVSCLLSSMQQNRHIESHALHSSQLCGSFPITIEMPGDEIFFRTYPDVDLHSVHSAVRHWRSHNLVISWRSNRRQKLSSESTALVVRSLLVLPRNAALAPEPFGN